MYFYNLQDVAPDDTIPEVDSDDNDSIISGLSAGYDPPKTVGRIHIANAGKTGLNTRRVKEIICFIVIIYSMY